MNENNIEINDDKSNNEIKTTEQISAEKDAKSIAREERRKKQQEEDEKKIIDKTSRPKDAKTGKIKKNKLSYEQQQTIKKYSIIAFIVLLFALIAGPLVHFVNNSGNPNQPKGLLLLTDMTGYTAEDAIDNIKKIGFINIKKEYLYDQFTQDGCVIKTNYHINSELKPDAEIVIFVCDKSLIQEEEPEKTEDNQSADRTYFTMDNISIVDMAIKDNTFYAILKNNNHQAIKNIQYRIGYQNSDGSDIGENKYMLDKDFTVLPGEKLKVSMEIRNSYAYYLYVSGLTYDKVDVPESERN